MCVGRFSLLTPCIGWGNWIERTSSCSPIILKLRGTQWIQGAGEQEMKKGRLLYAMNNTLQNSPPTNIVIITSIKGAWIDSRRKSNLPWELKGSLHARYSQPLNTVLAGSIKALTLVLFVDPSKTIGCTLCETECWTQGTAGLVGLIPLFLPPSLKITER